MQNDQRLSLLCAEEKARIVLGFGHAEPEEVAFPLHFPKDVRALCYELESLLLKIFHALDEPGPLGIRQVVDEKLLRRLPPFLVVKANRPGHSGLFAGLFYI